MTQEIPEPTPNEAPEPAPLGLPEPMQKCANCGADLRPTDRYCGGCGLPAFVPASAEAPKEVSATPGVVPAQAEAPKITPLQPTAPTVPPAPKAAGGGTWAVVTGVILIILGVAGCALGAIAMLGVSWISTTEDAPYWLGGTGLLCVLPSVLLAIAGAVVWYIWGRKKS